MTWRDVGKSLGKIGGKHILKNTKMDLAPWKILDQYYGEINAGVPIEYDDEPDLTSLPLCFITKLSDYPKNEGRVRYRKFQLTDPYRWQRAHGKPVPFVLVQNNKLLPHGLDLQLEPQINNFKEILGDYPELLPYFNNYEILLHLLYDPMGRILELETQIEAWQESIGNLKHLIKNGTISNISEIKNALEELDKGSVSSSLGGSWEEDGLN